MNALIKEVQKQLISSGGFSLSLKLEAPKSGYMVSLQQKELIINDDVKGLKKKLYDYFNNNYDIVNNNKKLFFGGWINEGKIYLDISENVLDKKEAIQKGMERQQLAIFNVNDFTEIFLKSEVKK